MSWLNRRIPYRKPVQKEPMSDLLARPDVVDLLTRRLGFDRLILLVLEGLFSLELEFV